MAQKELPKFKEEEPEPNFANARARTEVPVSKLPEYQPPALQSREQNLLAQIKNAVSAAKDFVKSFDLTAK